MTIVEFLSAGLPTPPTKFDPVQLFLDADIVVQVVMAGLLLASVMVWSIVIALSARYRRVRKRNEQFENAFWQAENYDSFMKAYSGQDVPLARVTGAAMTEWRRSTKGGIADRDGLRQRLAQAMDGQIAEEIDNLSSWLGFLATVGSVAPFIGLFGTVWGIMNSFFQIGAQQNTSLDVVAPGISEALFATAIGLFAAIPAVIAYNRFGQGLDRLEAGMRRFADRFYANLSRQLERL